uniref:Uncharacterized protein n=1 Tax=Anguilla anguilla TaxID=7936 RepID=A0A0E9WXG7_ANGAN
MMSQRSSGTLMTQRVCVAGILGNVVPMQWRAEGGGSKTVLRFQASRGRCHIALSKGKVLVAFICIYFTLTLFYSFRKSIDSINVN